MPLALVGCLLVIVAPEAAHAAAARALGFDDVRVGWLPPRTSYTGSTL